MALGKNVKTLREQKNWTLKELSQRSKVPVGTIGAIEVRDSVRSEYASKLALALGVSTDELITGQPTSQAGTTSPLHTNDSNQAPALAEHAQTAIYNEASAKELLIQLGALLQKTDPITRAQTAPILAQLAKTPELAAELGTRLDDTITMGTKAPFVPFNPFPNK